MYPMITISKLRNAYIVKDFSNINTNGKTKNYVLDTKIQVLEVVENILKKEV